ncbi:MAG: SDR family NAD(P)-dependent oxidoreductase, partial [Chlamydiales bacterium]|nr:SDR family NAD(P)-dependent oxidoreductase [Chlamydiales bacterium]
KNLLEGKEQVTRFTDEELSASGVAQNLVQDPSFIKVKAVVENAEQFDAEFFNYRGKEADHIEPQERLLYETVWEALEDAGCIPGSYSGTIGLYAGAFFNLYWPLQNILKNGDKARLDLNQFDDKDFICTRTSYKLNLTGPSVAVQTACSTSLVAVHLACRALLTGECQVAVAGGSSVKLPIKFGHFYAEGGVYSRDGHLRAFDTNADGIVEGDGVGAVVLKRLEDAINDGDPIYAVIKGSAVNNDGNNKVGYYSPSINGQLDVLQQCYQTAEIDPSTLRFVECHGTGTQLGDQIEVAALKQAIKPQMGSVCALGSAKNNYGHTAAAAGILSFIKAVLSIKNKTYPPHINYTAPHPKLELQNSSFYISAKPIDLSKSSSLLRGAVSSFGIGGTNAHVVLEEFAQHPGISQASAPHLLVFSARTETALKQGIQNFCHHLTHNEQISLDDAAFTLQTGRGVYEYRSALVVESRQEALVELQNSESSLVLSKSNSVPLQQVIFMFPGQGAHYVDMGRDLYHSEPVFFEAFEECRNILLTRANVDIFELLYGAKEATIHAIDTSPLLTFSFEYSLAKLLQNWGIHPTGLIGHSIGEYVAACISGVFSLQDALQLVVYRGQLMKRIEPGKMISVPLATPELTKILPADLDIAADHGHSCIVSGPVAKVEEFQSQLMLKKIITQSLNIEKAGHSAMMDAILPEYLSYFKNIVINEPQIPFVSNVTGSWIDAAAVVDPRYWVKQLRACVQFSKGLDTIFELGKVVLLEVGPGNSLCMLAHSKTPDKNKVDIIFTVKPQQQKGSDQKFLLKQISKYWLAGGALDWKAIHHGAFRRKVSLPTYAFDHKSYSSDVSFIFDANKAGLLTQDVRKSVTQWFYQPVWKVSAVAKCDVLKEGTNSYLIFAKANSLLDTVIQDLQMQGAEVTRVSYGLDFSVEGNTITLNPQQEAHYGLLAKHLSTLPRKINKIVHGWQLGDREILPGVDWLTSAKLLGFYSVVSFINAYNEFDDSTPMTLVALTSGLSDIQRVKCEFPEKSLLFGAIKVIPKELPHISCKSVDIEGLKGSELTQMLQQEMRCTDQHQVISYLASQRYVEEFMPLTFESKIPSEVRLKNGGTYIITGGVGGIGLTLAEFITSKVKANIILFGRKPFLEPHEWDAYLAKNFDTELSKKIRSLQSIKSNALSIQVWQANVAHAQEMQNLFEKAKDVFGKVDGVIHCAGAFDGNMLFENTQEKTEQVLAAKVDGTLIIDRLLNDEADFFVLCSSLSSHLASVGQLNYCAASVFLDYFAKYKMSHSRMFTLSINWDAWKEVGGAVQTITELSKKMQGNEIRDITVSHPVLKACISQAPTQVVFEGSLDPHCWIVDHHRVMNKPTLPGVGFLELVTSAFRAYTASHSCTLNQVYLLKPLQVAVAHDIRIVFNKSADDYAFSILAALPNTDAWEEHAKGMIANRIESQQIMASIQQIKAECPSDNTQSFCEKLAEESTTVFGDQWQSSVKGYWKEETHAVIELELAPKYLETLKEYKLHPALFDHCMSILAEGKAYVPFLYEEIRIFGDLTPHLFAKITATTPPGDDKVINYSVSIYDETGRVLVEVDNYTLLRLDEPLTQEINAQEPSTAKPFSAYGQLIASNSAENDFVASILADAITCEEGKEVFARTLNSSYCNLIVSTKGFHKRLEENNQEAPSIDDAFIERDTRTRPEMSVQYVEPKSANEMKLAKVWQDLLGIDKVGIHDSFFDLGATSLQIIQSAAQIKKALSVKVSIVNLYTYPTIAELITHLFPQEEAPSETQDEGDGQSNKRRLLDRRQKLLEV